MRNTRNDIEELAAAQSVTLTGASLGNDRNAIEQIAAAKSVAAPADQCDARAVELLAAALD